MPDFAIPERGGGASARSIDAVLEEAFAALHRDRARCAELLDQVGEALVGGRDMARRAALDHLRAVLQRADGDVSGAVRLFRSARRSWLAAGRPLEAHLAMLGRTEIIAAVGEYAEARTLLEEMQGSIEEVGEADPRLASVVHVLTHLQLGEAIAVLEGVEPGLRHLDIAEDLAWDIGDLHLVGEIARRRGVCLLDANLHHRAVEELFRAREAFVDAGSRHAAVEILLPLADGVAALGDLGTALDLLRLAESVTRTNPWAAAERDVTVACALLRTGLADEALELARSAETAFIDMGLMLRSARAGFVSAIALINLGRHSDALDELTLVEQLYAGAGATTRRDIARLYRARLALVAGDPVTAARIAAQLHDEVDPGAETAPRQLAARVRMLLAETTDDPDRAEALLAEATDSVARLSDVQMRLELRLARARHLRRTGRAGESRAQLRGALDLGRIHTSRNLCNTDGSGRFPWQQALDELIAALVEDGGHAGLTEAWQRSRAVRTSSLDPLVQQACSMLTPLSAGHPPPRHAHPPGDGDRDELNHLLRRARRASVRHAAGETLPAVPEGPVLDYYVVGGAVVAFVIREGLVHARLLTGAAMPARHLVHAWQQECRLAAVVPPQQGMPTSPALDGLYAMLVEPIADLLAGLDVEHLDVVLDDQLHAVPFDALLDLGGPWRRRLGAGGEIVLRHEADPDAPPVTALVLAVPDSLAPQIAVEATLVAEALPEAEILIGAEATAAVLAEKGREVDVVHIAAHGEFTSGNPLFSAVRLGSGWLRAVDLVDGAVKLDGALVVLSACGSGRTTSPQPQPLSLAWAFVEAGAGGVVASLWDIDDEVTLLLMGHLYERLGAGEHPRDALSAARRAVAERYPHPYYWAPFRYFGAG